MKNKNERVAYGAQLKQDVPTKFWFSFVTPRRLRCSYVGENASGKVERLPSRDTKIKLKF